MKVRFAIALLVAMLCASAVAQDETADDWFDRGREMLGKAPLEDVIDAYDKALEIDPENATYWSSKGSALSFFAMTNGGNNERYNESIAAYNRSLQLDPKNPWTWDQMGSTLLQMKRYNESIEARDNAIRYIDGYQGGLLITKSEMLSSIWAGKALTFQEAGRMDEALNAYDEALEINPGNYEARMMKVRAIKAMEKEDGSAQAYEITGDHSTGD